MAFMYKPSCFMIPELMLGAELTAANATVVAVRMSSSDWVVNCTKDADLPPSMLFGEDSPLEAPETGLKLELQWCEIFQKVLCY